MTRVTSDVVGSGLGGGSSTDINDAPAYSEAARKILPESETRMRLTNQTKLNRMAQIVLGAVSGAALMALLGMIPAHAASPPACLPLPHAITACGCVITQSKIYVAASHLSADQSDQPNCIEIAARKAILNLQGFAVTGRGDGKGIGILIRKGADHVIVEGGLEADNTPAQNPSQDDPASNAAGQAQSTINLWNIGIEDDGDDAVIALFTNIGGSLFQPMKNNATAGVFLNHVKNSLVGDLRASFNGKFGIVVKQSSKIHIANVATQANGQTGLWLDSSNDNMIGPATSPGNGKYGTLLFSSSNNTIHDGADPANIDTGIVVGCGFDKKNCTGNEKSDHNRVVNSGATGNKVRGVAIRKHSENNIVTVNHNDGNGGEKMDMVDENNKCDHNIWYNNTGSTAQSCIH